jgi:hypothetical protein
MDRWDKVPGISEDVKKQLRTLEEMGMTEETQQAWTDEQDDVQVIEPILAKKDCKVRIDFAESVTWKVKDSVPGHAGEEYKAAKVTHTIIDEDVRTEHENAKPRLVIEQQFNLQKYPYLSQKKGTVEWLGRNMLWSLEEALGFEPVFMRDGQRVEPHITRTGRKVAPKGEGIKRQINPEFARAYFNQDGTVKPDNWIDKEVYADVEVEESEQYGDKNVIVRYKPTPQV